MSTDVFEKYFPYIRDRSVGKTKNQEGNKNKIKNIVNDDNCPNLCTVQYFVMTLVGLDVRRTKQRHPSKSETWKPGSNNVVIAAATGCMSSPREAYDHLMETRSRAGCIHSSVDTSIA
jgi:hypothetical protein